MRHLTYYYAIGFAVIGCATLIGLFQTFTTIVLNDFEAYAVTALIMAMFLPFTITALSWRDWRRVQKKQPSTREE
jgi:ABC-type transport system involved in Fe-S cluster assembly fused permease/ATPase subunit